jgi:hypothetical protein
VGGAVAVRDPAVAERFAYYLRRNPHDGRYFEVRVGRDGRTDPDELAHLVLIRTRLEGAHTRPYRGPGSNNPEGTGLRRS